MNAAAHRRDDPPGSREHMNREYVNVSGWSQKTLVLMSAAQLLFMLGFAYKVGVWRTEWKQEKAAFVTVDDAVSIQRQLIAATPEPIRASVAQVNVRDIIADRRAAHD